MNFFDIETGPLPDEELALVEPEFVANRTLKDPVKITADLAEKRANWKERAALSPVTGRVLAIGLLHKTAGLQIIHGKPEQEMLSEFWSSTAADKWAGFGIFHFDLPFLIRRSWFHRVPVPMDTRERYWNPRFVDIREQWLLGDREFGGSLDLISRFLRTGQKNGNGADFAKLYAEQPDAALVYLRNDLMLTARAYLVMNQNIR